MLVERGDDVLIVAVGAMAALALDVAERLDAQGIGVTVVDPRWVIPVNPALAPMAARFRLVATIEDNGRVGGVGAAVSQTLRDAGVYTPARDFGMPREFPAHGKRAEVMAAAGLTAQDVARQIVEAVTRLQSATDAAAVHP